MILTINIPEKDIPKMQFIMDISLHFLDGQLVEYTAPSGWDIEKQKSCEDCISREDALMALTGQCADSPIELLPKAIKQINALPPVTPQPKMGRWEKAFDEYSYWYRCSCCGNKILTNEWGTNYFSPYCPECGAIMNEEEE